MQYFAAFNGCCSSRDTFLKRDLIYRKIFNDDKMEQQQRNEKTMQMEEEIARHRYNLDMLKGQRIENEEIKKLANSVVETVNLMSQEMRPQLIRYCKSYMGWKSRHKRELLSEGKIRYIKYPDCNERMDLKN